MFISACLAYSDITAELIHRNETFTIALKTPDDGDIHITLNYLQAKIVADSLAAIINQAPVKELVETECGNILGGMGVTFCLPSNTIDSEKGEQRLCRQTEVSVRMESALLSESA